MERKTVSLMVLLVALIFTIAGGTFAYLTWQLTEENRNSLVFTVTGDFSCSVDGGGNVNTEGVTFMPVDSANCNNSEHILKRELTFNVVKNYTNDVKLYSWFNINNLGSYLRGNSNFKWVLSSEESCTEGIVKSGDFSELTDESEKIILFNDVYNETTISKYYLYMWLDKEETRIPDEDINSRIFDLSLDGECGENKVAIDSAITEITNYSTTPIPVIITNNNDYPVTASISFKDVSLVENLEIPANTTVNHDVYLSESAFNQGNLGKNNYLTIAVMDNGLQINYNQIVGYTIGLNYLGKASASDTDFFGQEFTRANVKTITFMGSNTAPAIETRTLQGTIDVSNSGNGSIMAYYYESDTSGHYDFYIGSSDGVVYANPDSRFAFGGVYNSSTKTYYGTYSNLISINGMEHLDTSKVTTMYAMFQLCSGLTTLNLSNFDTSQVTDMSYMFYGCSGLTTLNVSNFDTSNVTNMYAMFSGCSGLTTLNVSNFDTSNVATMLEMFWGCSGLTSLNVSSFVTSKVTNMRGMFCNCSNLTTLNVSNFDTSNVTNMYAMFYNCSGLTTLDLSNFDTSKVTDMSYMFSGCSGLTSLDLSNFDTSRVTNMYAMFQLCSGLTTLNLSNFDTSRVTNMCGMFYNCSGLTTLNVSNFDTSKVTTMYAMFYNCSGLTTLNVSNFDSVTTYSYMFYSVPTTVSITVGSDSAKSWLNTNYSSYTNVVIG